MARIGTSRGAHRALVGQPEGRRPLRRLRCRGGIILTFILDKWDGGMDWTNLAQDGDRWRAVVNAVMNLWFP